MRHREAVFVQHSVKMSVENVHLMFLCQCHLLNYTGGTVKFQLTHTANFQMFILFINTRVSAYCSAVIIFKIVELDSARSCHEAQSLQTELENLSGRFSLRRIGKI